MSHTVFNNICIIGVGLIGGSLARALKANAAVQTIIGAGRNQAHLDRALELGVIDEANTDLAQAVSKADLLVLAVPVGTMHRVLQQIADHIPKHCVMTDVGSTKGSVVEDARQVFGTMPTRFIPGHPIAGTVMMVSELGVQPQAWLFSSHIDSISAGGLIIDDVWNKRRVVTIDLLGDEFLEAVKTGDPVSIHEDGTVEIG